MRPRAEWAIDSETMRARGIIADDILHAIDSSRVVVLLMLDLSAAFDTVYHRILLNRLSQRNGIQDPYKDVLHSTCHLVHNLLKLNVQDLLYVNLIAVYHMGLFLGLCYMFCTPYQWLLS